MDCARDAAVEQLHRLAHGRDPELRQPVHEDVALGVLVDPQGVPVVDNILELLLLLFLWCLLRPS